MSQPIMLVFYQILACLCTETKWQQSYKPGDSSSKVTKTDEVFFFYLQLSVLLSSLFPSVVRHCTFSVLIFPAPFTIEYNNWQLNGCQVDLLVFTRSTSPPSELRSSFSVLSVRSLTYHPDALWQTDRKVEQSQTLSPKSGWLYLLYSHHPHIQIRIYLITKVGLSKWFNL